MTRFERLLLLAASSLACTSGDRGSAASETSEQHAASATPSAADRSIAASSASECKLPGSYGAAACDECLNARCCTELAACNADADCQRDLECTLRCVSTEDPPQCFAACFSGGDMPATFTAFDDCSFNECEAACFE